MKGAIIGAIGGIILVVAAIYYLAWVANIGKPVDWTIVLQSALYLAPFGAIIGAIIGSVVEAERRIK